MKDKYDIPEKVFMDSLEKKVNSIEARYVTNWRDSSSKPVEEVKLWSNNGIVYYLTVRQDEYVRVLKIRCNKNVSIEVLNSLLLKLETLIMLLEGSFHTLISIKFDLANLLDIESELIKRRLRKYFTMPGFRGLSNRYYEFDSVVTVVSKYFKEWLALHDDIDKMLTFMLVLVSDNDLYPVMRCGGLSELLEPLSRYIKERDSSYTYKINGNGKTYLSEHIKCLIKRFGNSLFKEEYEKYKDIEKYIDILVKTRNYVAHINESNYAASLEGPEAIFSCYKLLNFYRVVLLSLLGLDNKELCEKANRSIVYFKKNYGFK